MKAFYQNEYGELETCTLLAYNLTGTFALIKLDGSTGWCSAHLVEPAE